MSININPEKFAELVVSANPSKKETAEDIAKDSIELYINAYRIAERYSNIASHKMDTSESLSEIRDTRLGLCDNN
ncbi:hypothetical protein DOS70_10560 [Staphylococcus felis]|uniref:Uncharacterized protein n=1 Tax=Staphylococcus felis TaxID=46127 RepID=A0A3E0IFZ2_9STAP|nr:hypothetical protein [Staphylococcus felis]MBH9579916.1 hypothetical protein [Staphylococcus felis]MDM8328627.1 hypothetical protein [Staphylococcus felis]REH74864.1 hypothetical protein DOS60_10505 [Staphylococcus felis]REH78518.1 hypothetical protein DOS57_04915 [Staphylococcus felis]REH79183.1 hypothetical protein DOS59_04010 [Staphylococcus felis]